MTGPQENRFTSQWDGAGEKGKINAARSMWTTLGTFLLWFGWYGFNIGSILFVTDGSMYLNADLSYPSDGVLMGKIGMNTTLAGAGGSIFPLLLNRYLYKSWDINILFNGILAGLVSITSGCAIIDSWAAFITGRMLTCY